MRELCRKPDLAKESLAPESERDLGVHDLEGDSAIVSQVCREINSGHPASSNFALDAVAITKQLEVNRWRHVGGAGFPPTILRLPIRAATNAGSFSPETAYACRGGAALQLYRFSVTLSHASRTASFMFSHVLSPRPSKRSKSARSLGSMSLNFFPR